MQRNDVIILNSILDQKKSDLSPSQKDNDFFSLFSYDQVLKD